MGVTVLRSSSLSSWSSWRRRPGRVTPMIRRRRGPGLHHLSCARRCSRRGGGCGCCIIHPSVRRDTTRRANRIIATILSPRFAFHSYELSYKIYAISKSRSQRIPNSGKRISISILLLAPSHTPRSKRNRRRETYDTQSTAPTHLCSRFHRCHTHIRDRNTTLVVRQIILVTAHETVLITGTHIRDRGK